MASRRVDVTALLEDNPSPYDAQIYRGLEGNLCRCTGDINLVKAVKKAANIMNVQSDTA